MTEFILSALGAVAGILAVCLLLLLPRMWREQKKINLLFKMMKEDQSDD